MSSKNTLFRTKDNEHAYLDCSEQYTDKDGERQDAITIEFDKKNIRIDWNDENKLIITIINVDSDIYKIMSKKKNNE